MMMMMMTVHERLHCALLLQLQTGLWTPEDHILIVDMSICKMHELIIQSAAQASWLNRKQTRGTTGLVRAGLCGGLPGWLVASITLHDFRPVNAEATIQGKHIVGPHINDKHRVLPQFAAS
jgi:hypothetical protein